jgi:hypothetical protein
VPAGIPFFVVDYYFSKEEKNNYDILNVYTENIYIQSSPVAQHFEMIACYLLLFNKYL